MRRRRFIATAGAAALAGCSRRVGRTSDGAGDRREDDRRDRSALVVGESATVGDRTVTVQSLAVRQQYVAKRSTLRGAVRGSPDEQYLLVNVMTSGDTTRDLARDRVAVVADGTRYGPVDERYPVFRGEEPAGRSTVVGVALDRPLRAEAGRVVWDDGAGRAAWRLPRRVLQSLRNPPSFELRSFSVPDRGPPGGSVTATVTVANVGDSRGLFVGELGTAREETLPEFLLDVPAGRTATHEQSIPLPPESGSRDVVEVVLRTAAGTRRATVRTAE